MRKELRINKDGTSYYSFLFFDKKIGKRIRLSKDYIRKRFGRDITDENDAVRITKILDAEYETLRLRLTKRAEWENEFHGFNGLLKEYSTRQQKNAPNSYKNNVHFLKHYVLHYFLNIVSCNNIDFWPNYYDSFKEWLETKAELIKQPGKLISYGSKNHCIKALNTFMRHLYQDKILQKLQLCEKFPSYKLNERTIDDVISEEEMNKVYEKLLSRGYKIESTFYRMLYFTGMRSNEGLGISLNDLQVGDVQHESLKRLLARHEIQYKGYLVLSSQPDHPTKGLRNKDGHIYRKPLKGRKKIGEKYSRVIVISDELLWKDLVDLYNIQVEKMNHGTWGSDPKDYALFDGFDKTTGTRRLREAYEALDLRYRSWHCCRHSCATNLIGKTGDYSLARLWLGHSSPTVIEKYVHVHQSIVRMANKRVGEKQIFKKIES